MCLQEDGDTKKLFTAGATYKTVFECENFPTPPPLPVKTIMVPSLRSAGSHGEEETVFFSPLPSPPLFIPLVPTFSTNSLRNACHAG